MLVDMLVTLATDKLEITILHSSLEGINLDIIWKRMWQPGLPKRPGNRPCPVPTRVLFKGKPQWGPWGGGRQWTVYKAEMGLSYWL